MPANRPQFSWPMGKGAAFRERTEGKLEMTYLNMQMTASGKGKLLDGACSREEVKKIPFLSFLGVELIARSRGGELLSICQEAFAFLAKAGNDEAAADVLDIVAELMMTTRQESPFSLKLSVEEFAQKKRQDESALFEYINSLYWELPLYYPDNWEERTNGDHGFLLGDRIPKTKQAVIGLVASLWDGQYDKLGEQALEFLADCYESRRFAKRVPQLIETIREYRKRSGYGIDFEGISIPNADSEFVLQKLRQAMPSKLEVITLWLEKTRQSMPLKIHRLFGHAFINAGGNVLASL